MTLQDRFSTLLEQYVQKLRVRGDRAIGCCPFHDDQTPSFSADLEKGVWHCFGCGANGGVKRFSELLGEAWESAPETCQQRARRLALAAARAAYTTWEKRTFACLIAERRQLEQVQQELLSFYSIIEKLDEENAQWLIHEISEGYDKLTAIEYRLDILTERDNKKERMAWWKQEEQNIAA